ncbi:hypothetical protein EC973_000380, partial [Apophysomyces ossiformis]
MSGQKTTFSSPLALSSANLDHIAHLEALMTQLSERVMTFEAVLQENTELCQCIIKLETRLATVNPSSTATSAPVQPRTDSSPPWASSQASSWAKVAAHPLKNSVSCNSTAYGQRRYLLTKSECVSIEGEGEEALVKDV